LRRCAFISIEALRLYIDKVNAAGGVNGKPVNLLIENDLTLPWKAGANARKFLTEDNAVLMLNASLSMTYAAVVTEAKSAGVPLIFAGSVCPKDVNPPAAEDAFCTTAFAATYDSRAALSFVHDAAAEPVKVAFVAMAIPLSRMEIDFAAGEAPRLGMRSSTRKAFCRRPRITRRSLTASRTRAPTGSIPGLRG
jgi:branched-chain amino acid transport system substrate-binding protein